MFAHDPSRVAKFLSRTSPRKSLKDLVHSKSYSLSKYSSFMVSEFQKIIPSLITPVNGEEQYLLL